MNIIVRMLNRLNFDLMNYILEFLPNHEIMEFIYLNKNINKMFQVEKLKEFMECRKHPIVFNIIDNYCYYCNQGLIFLGDDIHSRYIFCNHV